MGKNWIPIILWLLAVIWSVTEAHGSRTPGRLLEGKVAEGIAAVSAGSEIRPFVASPSRSLDWTHQWRAER